MKLTAARVGLHTTARHAGIVSPQWAYDHDVDGRIGSLHTFQRHLESRSVFVRLVIHLARTLR